MKKTHLRVSGSVVSSAPRTATFLAHQLSSKNIASESKVKCTSLTFVL